MTFQYNLVTLWSNYIPWGVSINLVHRDLNLKTTRDILCFTSLLSCNLNVYTGRIHFKTSENIEFIFFEEHWPIFYIFNMTHLSKYFWYKQILKKWVVFTKFYVKKHHHQLIVVYVDRFNIKALNIYNKTFEALWKDKWWCFINRRNVFSDIFTYQHVGHNWTLFSMYRYVQSLSSKRYFHLMY